jgi:hypothetical protein
MEPNDFPNVKAWRDRVMTRPAVARGMAIKADPATVIDATKDKAAFDLLFRQGAKK